MSDRQHRALPHWPRRMKLRFAAAYVDESETKFLQGVKAGKWPQGSRDGGNVYWYKEDLDAAVDRLKRIGADNKNAAAVGTDADDDDGWEDVIGQT
jgi:hypothetical protein